MGLTVGLCPTSVVGGGGSDELTLLNLGYMEISAQVKNTGITEFPLVDTSGVTDMASMFQYCSNLTTVPLLDTSNVKSMSMMFYMCKKLKNIPLFNTSKNTSCYQMFEGCASLESLPELDFSNVTEAGYMFRNCTNLKTVSRIDMPKCNNMYNMFISCSRLESVPFLNVTNVGNFGNAFMSCTALVVCNLFGLKITVNFSQSPLLSKESVSYIFENAQTVSGQKITLHADVFAQLTEDEIAIATEKGFSVVSA